jgi:hypothetical protein
MCIFRAGLAQEVPSKLKIPDLSGQLWKRAVFSGIHLRITFPPHPRPPTHTDFTPFGFLISIYAVRPVPLSLPSHCYQSKR